MSLSLRSLSVRGLRRRPARTALTGAGAALGVAVLYTVVVISGATTSALDDEIAGSAGRTDVYVGAVGSYDATIPSDTPARVQALPQVQLAMGTVVIRSLVATQAELAAGTQVFDRAHILFVEGVDFDVAAQVHDYPLRDGRLPTPGAPELVVADSVADDLGLATGTAVQIATPAGSTAMTVVGVLDGEGAGLGFQGTASYTSIPVAQVLLGKGDVLTTTEVVLADGVDADGWIAAHRTEIGEGLALQTPGDGAAGFRSFIQAISSGLTLLSAIALFVGGFLVFLTFSVAVAEQTRTYGTLRALGSKPQQVRRVVAGEAAALGLGAGIVGVLLGRLIAQAGVGATGALLGLRLRSIGFPLGPAVLGVAVGVGLSVVAAWIPGRRAAALSPVVAMRTGATAVDRTGRLPLRIGILAAGIALGFVGHDVALEGLAALLVLTGAVLLAPFVLGPVAGVVGRATSRVGRATGVIAVNHLVKERSRSAYTLALVMVVLAMLLSLASANTAMRRLLDRIVEREAGGSVQVYASGAFDETVQGELEAVPGTGTVTPIRAGHTGLVRSGGDVDVDVTLIDPATYFQVAGFVWVDGDDAGVQAALAAGGAVALPASGSVDPGAHVGDTVELRTSDGIASFTVAGRYAVLGPGFGVVAGVADSTRFGAGRPNAYLVDAEDGVDPEALKPLVLDALRGRYQPIVDTPASTKKRAVAQLQGFFGLSYSILLASAIAGLLGLANTLAVSVLARTREIGILRSVGTRRRGVRRLVLVEAVTLAAVAYVLALPLGFLLSLGTSRAFSGAIGASIEFAFAWPVLVPLLVATVLIAAIASMLPARRAGRLEPVAALRFD